MSQASVCASGDAFLRAMLDAVDAVPASGDHNNFLRAMRAFVEHAKVCDECGIKIDVMSPAAKRS